MSHTKLSVNVNAIAHLRNRRDLPWPSVAGLSRIALEAGAAGITVHPRPDERHIRRTDVFALQEMLRTDWPGREYNIEGYPTEDFLKLCEAARPDQVTLVPDMPGQNTSDHGWDCVANQSFLSDVVRRIQGEGMRASIFIDADPTQAAAAALTGTRRVEIYTGPWAEGHAGGRPQAALEACADTARRASVAGLGVNAGHDLSQANLGAFLEAVPAVQEVSIGHALIGEALYDGLDATVRGYLAILARTAG